MVPTGVAVVTLPPAALPARGDGQLLRHGVAVAAAGLHRAPQRDEGPRTAPGDLYRRVLSERPHRRPAPSRLVFRGRLRPLGEPLRRRAGPDGGPDAPVFEESLAYIDCSVHDSHQTGDHTIYVGAVESADVLNRTATPLTHFRSDWHAAPE